MNSDEQAEHEQLRDRYEFIGREWDRRYRFSTEWSLKAYQYLFLTNSGGSIATLSFLGASDEARGSACIAVALLLFVVGLLLIGVCAATIYMRSEKELHDWAGRSNKFMRRDMNWETLVQRDDKAFEWNLLGFGLAWASFGFFLVGCLVGVVGLVVALS